MRLAPIGIPVYSRLDHLRQTISALQGNDLASDSELYLFSDGPRPGDETKVDAVRKYMKTIKGFQNVHIIERKENNYVFNNNEGNRMLLNKYGRMIFLEEDIITAPSFLRFMNKALDFYEGDERIIAVCGYTPPIKFPRSYKKDVYLSPRFSAWGAGYWKSKYDKIITDISVKDHENIVRSRGNLKAFTIGGPDLLAMLEKEAKGEIDAMDVKIFYTQYVRRMFTVHPVYSLTNNIGFDGTGMHCGDTDRFNVDLSRAPDKAVLDADLQLDKGILRRLSWFRGNKWRGLAYRMRQRFLVRMGAA